MLRRFLLSLFLGFIPSLSSYAAGYSIYHLDRSVLDKYPELATPYRRLQDAFEKGELSRSDHRTRLNVLQKLLDREPDWIDGYWLFSAEAFVLASAFDAPREYPDALQILDEGVKAGENCLKKDSGQILCKFFLASCMAKKASMEGIFSSLRYGFRIHALWSDVLASPYEFWFRPNSSLQGSVRYGLGIFYRLVPNRWIMQTMFRIRGNMDRSIQLHREGVAINPDDPCSRLMLGSALLCRCRGDSKSADCQEGATQLETVKSRQAFDGNQKLCQRDGELLLRDSQLACGYTQALQVSEDMEKTALQQN